MVSPGRRLRDAARMLSLTLILNGCVTTTGFGGIDRSAPSAAPTELACGAFGPIGWSKTDSGATIRQIKAHNAAYAALCAQPNAADHN